MKKEIDAACMRCGEIHPHYKFKPGQSCYILWCKKCGTQMHKPAAGERAG